MSSSGVRRGFLKREPSQARGRSLVAAVVETFDQMLRNSNEEREVTIEALLHRAGVSVGSFYEYFSNRDSLVGSLFERATRDNFAALLAKYDAAPPASLDEAVAYCSLLVAHAYLEHRVRTRVLIAGIGKLGLMAVVVAERDRFAAELAKRVERFDLGISPARVTAAMILACDAAMGVVTAELYRPPRAVEQIGAEIAAIALAIIAMAAPQPTAGP